MINEPAKNISRRSSSVRRGFSLLEVTVASMMAAAIVVLAASVAVDMARGMAGNIVETQVAAEARLAIESIRRDFSGTCPEEHTGDRDQWRLVGRLIPSPTELRLCFDADKDASADWIAPDRVVTYSLSNNQLVRTDALSGAQYTVARHVDDVEFVLGGDEITISLDFVAGDFATTYTFLVSDVL